MNRIERLTAILLLLGETPRTSESIARRFEVSRRTVLRDIQALCEMGLPIVAREGSGGGYSLPADYRIAPLPLSAQEAFLLLFALGAIAGLSTAPFGSQRASLFAKLQSVMPAQHEQDVAQMLSAVRVDVPPRAVQAPWLDALMVAVQQAQWVELSYQSPTRLSTQRVLPLQITLQNSYWYCRAFAYEHGEERTYRVDRVCAVLPLSEQPQLSDTSAARPYNHESHPEISVTLTARGVALVEDEPHLGSQVCRQPDGTGTLVFRCPPRELDWYARYFAGLGQHACVHAPAELRARLAQLGRELAARYDP